MVMSSCRAVGGCVYSCVGSNGTAGELQHLPLLRERSIHPELTRETDVPRLHALSAAFTEEGMNHKKAIHCKS